MERIFTFGCSFVNYNWPTWADIILYGNDGYNLGVNGGGNESILYRILEGDRKFNYTNYDKIIVMFTSPLRWDYPVDDWNGNGNVYGGGEIYEKYNNKVFTINGLLFRSFYSMKIINDYLRNRGLNYIFSSMDNLYNNFYLQYDEISVETKNLIEYVLNEVKIDLLDMKKYTLGDSDDWNITKLFIDTPPVEYHRRPLEHFNWVKDVLLEKMDIELKITEDDILKIEKYIDLIKTSDEMVNINLKYPEFFSKRLNESIYINEDSFFDKNIN